MCRELHEQICLVPHQQQGALVGRTFAHIMVFPGTHITVWTLSWVVEPLWAASPAETYQDVLGCRVY